MSSSVPPGGSGVLGSRSSPRARASAAPESVSAPWASRAGAPARRFDRTSLVGGPPFADAPDRTSTAATAVTRHRSSANSTAGRVRFVEIDMRASVLDDAVAVELREVLGSPAEDPPRAAQQARRLVDVLAGGAVRGERVLPDQAE